MKNLYYEETESQDKQPDGDGWEFWGMKTTPDESVAVWRRENKNDTV